MCIQHTTKWRTESTVAFHVDASDTGHINGGLRRTAKSHSGALTPAAGRTGGLAVLHLGDAVITVEESYELALLTELIFVFGIGRGYHLSN